MVRSSGLLLVLGVLSVSLLSCGVAYGSPSRRCPPAHERVIAADVQAVVYKAPEAEASPGEIYACSYRSKHVYLVGPPSVGSSAGSVSSEPIVLAGAVVAYAPLEIGPYHERDEVWVRNLVTGKFLHRVPNGVPSSAGEVGSGETTALVVKVDGSVAWIARTSKGLDVWSVDRKGSHLLAVSPEIDPSSLALAGSTLYWLQGGRPYLASLD